MPVSHTWEQVIGPSGHGHCQCADWGDLDSGTPGGGTHSLCAFNTLQEKCFQYWPDQGCWTYGHIRVCVEDCVVLVDYTVRKFCIQSVSGRHWQPGRRLSAGMSRAHGACDS